MASQLFRGLRFALTDSGVPLRSCLFGATTSSAYDQVGHATHRRFSEAAASPPAEPAPGKPSIDALKYQFSSKIAQVTKGDPSNALSAVPAAVDLILESIPAAIHSVAITSVSPEVLRAANTGVGAGRPGDIPRLDVVFSLDHKQLLPAMHFLSKSASLQFNTLVEMTAVDWPERANARFEVTYVLYSPTLNMRCIVKVMVDELTPLESVTPIFKNANWLERETWDMFGVFFKNHPDLRRILTDYGFSHFPLRKDFPVQGYTEVAYSEERKAVTSRPVQLAQAHRVIKD